MTTPNTVFNNPLAAVLNQNMKTMQTPLGGEFHGLKVTWLSDTSVSVSYGFAVDIFSFQHYIILNETVTVDATRPAPNGLQIGIASLAPDEIYFVQLLGDSTSKRPTMAQIGGSAAQAAFITTGYNMARRLCPIFTDGSANIRKFYMQGETREASGSFSYWWDEPLLLLDAGTETDWTTLNLRGFTYAPIGGEVFLRVAWVPDTPGDVAYLRPYGSTNDDGTIQIVESNIAYMKMNSELFDDGIAETPGAIEYKVTAAGALTLTVLGFNAIR